jgi:aryl-alcohol dehydrogenase-like predicted oxidoreductase
LTGLPIRDMGGHAVSAIGLGCMNLSHAYGTPPDAAEAAVVLNRALDLGVTLLDTAALYGGGGNERLLGRSVMHRRAEFKLATKCVLDMVDGRRTLDGSPEAIVRSVDGSLARLGVDHVDLVYLHRLDPAVPVEASVGALARLKDAGKVGAIGLSEVSATTIRRAHAVHPVAAVQSEYSPVVRNPEVAVLSACRELGIGFVAFSPLARGLLSGPLRADDYAAGDIRLGMPRFVEPHLSHNLRAIAAFEALAAEAGLTPAQLSLSWVLWRAPHVIPIPGTRSVAHLEENVGVVTMTPDAALLGRVDALFVGDAIRGARYSAAMQAQIDTETLTDEELA